MSETSDPLAAAYLEGYVVGERDGYNRAMQEFLYPVDDPEFDWESEIVPIEDLLAIERIRQDYAQKSDYYSVPAERLA